LTLKTHIAPVRSVRLLTNFGCAVKNSTLLLKSTFSPGEKKMTLTNLVWVGTGEPANTRANSWGDGVYKSLDGGKTWAHMGLGESRQISAIVIHPTRPDTVYIAAMGSDRA
jgi:hypothetical protein